MSPELAEEASSNFLPGDWSSEKNSIKLVQNATLQPEQLIFSGGMYIPKEHDGVVDNGLQMLRNVGNAIGGTLKPKKKSV